MTSTSFASTRLRDLAAGAALGACLLLAGCVTPRGSTVPECDASWDRVAGLEGASNVTGALETIPIECYRVVAEQRVEVGIIMPPGPDCYAVNLVEVVESDEAVSLEVRIGPINNPFGGVCPSDELAWVAPVELNGPAAGRQVLDASRPSD